MYHLDIPKGGVIKSASEKIGFATKGEKKDMPSPTLSNLGHTHIQPKIGNNINQLGQDRTHP